MGSIAGTVRDALTGRPVSGVDVSVYYWASNGAPDGTVVHGPGFLADTQTAVDGTYRIGVPRSDSVGYWVCFSSGLAGPYEFQCWADQSTFFKPFPDPFGFFQLPAQSQPVQVAPGQHLSGIDGDLVVAAPPGSPSTTGSVTGRVTEAGTGKGVAGAIVIAFNADGRPVGHAVTALHGAYRLDSLVASTGDTICVDPTDAHVGATSAAFHGRCYPSSRWRPGSATPTDAQAVPVTVSGTTSNVNIALLSGAHA